MYSGDRNARDYLFSSIHVHVHVAATVDQVILLLKIFDVEILCFVKFSRFFVITNVK